MFSVSRRESRSDAAFAKVQARTFVCASPRDSARRGFGWPWDPRAAVARNSVQGAGLARPRALE